MEEGQKGKKQFCLDPEKRRCAKGLTSVRLSDKECCQPREADPALNVQHNQRKVGVTMMVKTRR